MYYIKSARIYIHICSYICAIDLSKNRMIVTVMEYILILCKLL